MPDTFEHMIEDIYTLEPTLREQDAEVRALVSSLVSAKPVVAVDATFVQSLRRELLTNVVPAPKAIPSPWMMYIAPLGAMAVLILMLVPGYLSNNTVELPTAAPEIMNTELQMDTDDGADMKRSADVAPEGASMMMAPSEESPGYYAGDMINVFDQVPGKVVHIESVTLTASGFVVIQSDAAGMPGAVLGVSPMLFAETSNLVEIPLTSDLTIGTTYFATLYHDDGDGVFTLESDYPAIHIHSGAPLMYMFWVSAPIE
jgi:hypothetical protein